MITQGTGAGYTSMGCSAAAGKTGTSEGLSDAWFVGYTPLFSTAVWTGHPQSREETGFGGPTSGPIWRYFMEQAVNGDCPEFTAPSTLPELSGLDSGHTSGSSSFSESESERTKNSNRKKKAAKRKAKRGMATNRAPPRNRPPRQKPLPRPNRPPPLPGASAVASPRPEGCPSGQRSQAA